ncbi:MAG: hypothetical protein EHM55_16375 [Acidobacteria bacterium]|nr:MAG: hypothetical protein EHM55_16375 [Acidobacteriota bacterium]
MKMVRIVCVAVIASFVIAALPKTTWAEGTPVSVDLRAAIDRAAAQSVAEARDTSSPFPGSRPAARAKQSMGGGGGSMMMVWTVVGTLTGLATTYFVVKEMRKQTERAAEGQ